MIFREEMEKVAAESGFKLNNRQIDKFADYYELLIEYNKVMNLTAIVEPKEVAIKHFIDSLAAYDEEVFKQGTTVIDVGSGAGFPGLPLKIYNEELCMTLVDSLGKRIKFLENVVDKLQLNGIKCVKARAEDAARETNMREKFAVATARAVAPLNILAEYVLPFVEVGGVMIALKGKKAPEEIKQAENAVTILGGHIINQQKTKLPEIDGERCVVTIKKTKETPNKYPRHAGIPQKNPL